MQTEIDPWTGKPKRQPILPQHNAHIIAHGIVSLQARLERGGYASADCYHADKDELRRLCAERVGVSEMHYDPMGFWFGRQSN